MSEFEKHKNRELERLKKLKIFGKRIPAFKKSKERSSGNMEEIQKLFIQLNIQGGSVQPDPRDVGVLEERGLEKKSKTHL